MLRATPQSPGNDDDKLDSKHQWMLQLLMARLYSHIIHLRSNEQFMHGITIENKLIPLHTLMSRLGHLIEKKQIAIYLPELLDPVVLKKDKDNYRSYPNNGQPLRVDNITIHFAPINAGEDRDSEETTPRTFPEILQHCEDCTSNNVNSTWLDLLGEATPNIEEPDADPPPGKRKRSDSGDVDGDGDVNDDAANRDELKPPPSPQEFPLTRSDYEALNNIIQILEKNCEEGGNLMPAMQNAFRLAGDDAIMAYLEDIPQQDEEDEYS